MYYSYQVNDFRKYRQSGMLPLPAPMVSEGAPTQFIKVNHEFYPLDEVIPKLSMATRHSGLLGVFRNWEEAEGIILNRLLAQLGFCRVRMDYELRKPRSGELKCQNISMHPDWPVRWRW